MSQAGTRAPAAELGLLDATMIGMGAMIGAGIFVLTGLAAEIAGPAAILVFALNAVVTAFTGICYAELASAIPKSGGGYVFVREVFRDLPSFLMGWMLGFAYMIAGALYALGFAANLVEFVHLYWHGFPTGPILPGGPTYIILYAILAVAGFVALNVLSTKASGGAETGITLVKIVILLVFAAFGAQAANVGEFDPLFPSGTSAVAILPAMGLTFIAFEGYDLITTVTEEVENPRVNIPRAIFVSLGATVIIYLLVVFVAIGTLGAEQLGAAGETGIAEAAKRFMPTIPVLGSGATFIAFGAVFSTLSALNAVVIASSRVVFAMGRENQLPDPLGEINASYGTPAAAILGAAFVMLVSVALIPLERVGRMSSLFFLLSFVVVNASAIRLRRQRPDMERPYSMPLYPLPPILGIVLNLVLTYFLLRGDIATAALGAGWLLLGGVVYWLLNRQLSGGEQPPEKAAPDTRGDDAPTPANS